MAKTMKLQRPRHWSRPLAVIMLLAGGTFWFIGNPNFSESLNALGIVLVTVGLLTAILATKLEKLEKGLVRGIGLAQDSGEVGLVEGGFVGLVEDSSTYDYGPIITDSKRLVILLNDGRTWVSVHRDRLRKRFAERTKETVVFLIHPESPMVSVLALKAGSDVAVMRNRILETVQELETIAAPGSNLEILGHRLFNPHSLILGDDTALIMPYFVSRGGRTVPVWRFEDIGDDCYFRNLAEDMERLRMDAARLGRRRAQGPVDSRLSPDSSPVS